MRLTQFELDSIKSTFDDIFSCGKIYLFGSRVDDTGKGGDIDLYVVTKDTQKVTKKINFLRILKNKIGEQKIDLVISYDTSTPIEKEALKNSILLNL